MKKILSIILVLGLLVPASLSAKKKSFGNGLFWEVTKDGTLVISGNGDMPDFDRKRWDKFVNSPWAKKKNIKKIKIEEGVTSIGNYAFVFGCDKHTNNHDDLLGNFYFVHTSFIQNVQLPTTIKRIGSRAFYETGISDTDFLNEGLEVIEGGAFEECLYLRRVHLPSTVYTLGSGAFEKCRWLEDVTLSDNIKSIYSSTFEKCRSLRTLRLPRNLISIGYRAFYGCISLENIVFPDKLQIIGEEAFCGIGRATGTGRPVNLNISNSVKSIGKKAFYGNVSISHLPNWITEDNCEQMGIEVYDVKSYRRKPLDKDGNILYDSKNYFSVKKINDNNEPLCYEIDERESGSSSNPKIGILSGTGKWIVNLNKGYEQISSFKTTDGRRFYVVSKSRLYGPYGLLDSSGKTIVAEELDEIEYIGLNLIAFKIGYWGVMNNNGEIIVPTSRNYTRVGKYINLQKSFSFSKKGYRGECDSEGREISLVEVETPKSTKTEVATNKPSTSKQNTTTSRTTTNNQPKQETVTQQPRQPQRHVTMVPVQVWQPCGGCNGSGQCSTCFGTGTNMSGNSLCISCHGNRKCHFCAGNGGQNVVQYVEKVEYY